MPKVSGDGFDQRPELAFIRGPFYNESEIHPISLLSDSFRVRVIHSGPCEQKSGIHYSKAFCVGTILDKIPKVRRLYRESLERAIGNDKYLLGLKKVLSKSQVFDVPETYNQFSFQTARIALELRKPMVVTAYENTPFFKEENPRTQRQKRFVLSVASAFIAKTKQIAACLIAEGAPRERVHVIYTSVDTEEFAPRPKNPALLEKLRLRQSDQVVLIAGRLVWEKGVVDVIRACRMAMNKPNLSKNLKLLIVGEGKEKEHLQRLVKTLGMEAFVRFAGAFPYSEMPEIYNLADVMVSASKPYPLGQEQESRAIREVLASGIATIVTTCGGNAEIAGDTALLIPPADHGCMAEAIGRLLTNSDLRVSFGTKARARALSEFDPASRVEAMRSVYSSVLQAPQRTTAEAMLLGRANLLQHQESALG